MSLHSKTYQSDAEYQYRLAVYKDNLEYVEEHNRQNLGFTLGMNFLADLTVEEYRELYLQPSWDATEHAQDESILHVVDDMHAMAPTVDWRTKGAVTPVKNQGQCGSCWAFSTTGSVEGAYKIKAGQLISSSEQQLVDCSRSYGNQGCNGGLMDNAFKYVIAVKGLDTEASYGYTARDGTCHFNAANIGAKISSYRDVARGSESGLQSAVNGQPVSVAIDASQRSFQLYKSGVYYEAQCSSTRLDHGVLAVGYGSDTGNYWLVKNSWGTGWGMSGYIEMSKDRQNNCGIATQASYPIA
jgi:cathepsin L